MAEAVSPSGIAATAAPERPSLWTKLAYGFGAVAWRHRLIRRRRRTR